MKTKAQELQAAYMSMCELIEALDTERVAAEARALTLRQEAEAIDKRYADLAAMIERMSDQASTLGGIADDEEWDEKQRGTVGSEYLQVPYGARIVDTNEPTWHDA